MNDPVGALRWRGRYHLFFQYNPDGPVWGRPRWGHVSSADLATWRRHPVALEPGDDGPDRDGCWSGCARVERGVPTLYYTGVVGHTDENRVESVLRATSTDADTWHKDTRPVLDGPPAGAHTSAHRDPFVFGADGHRHLLLGSSIHTPDGPTGAVLRYTAAGRGGWRFDGVLFDGGGAWPVDTGALWECPQLIRFADGDALIVSVHDKARSQPMRGAVAFIGRLDGARFAAEFVHPIDRGDLMYAPTTLTLDRRVLLWGWIRDPRPDLGPSNPDRRVGAVSLPRDVRLRDGGLDLAVPDEIRALRDRVVHGPHRLVLGSNPFILTDIAAHAEITFDVAAGHGAVEVGLGRRWDRAAGCVTVADPARVGDATGTAPGSTRVTIIVDADIVEVFATGLPPHTTRMHRGWRRTMSLHAPRGGARVVDLTVHDLRVAIEGHEP